MKFALIPGCMNTDTAFYNRCVDTLEKAYGLLIKSNPENLDYDLYRSAAIKEFEIILEQSGKLLKKVLKPYFHSSIAVDKLYFKDFSGMQYCMGYLTQIPAKDGWNTVITEILRLMITE